MTDLSNLQKLAEAALAEVDSNGAYSTAPWVEFIAAASPSVVLELIGALRKAEELLAEARDDVLECLNNALPNAGYTRYDRRIKEYQDRLALIDAALKEN